MINKKRKEQYQMYAAKKVKLESKIKYNRVICQSQNNILKVQINTNKENLKYIIKEGSCV